MAVGIDPAPTVLFIVSDEIALLDLAGPLEVFSAANGTGARYRLVTASAGGLPTSTLGGFRLEVQYALEEFDEPVDTLMVIGKRGWATQQELIAPLRRLAPSARRVTSVCTAAFALAAAGLLDGRRATTHWALCAKLAGQYPQIDVTPDALFVRDGKIATSAGVTAGIDLALSLLEEDYGAEVARRVAKYLVVFMQRPGGQSQFSARARVPIPRSGGVKAVLDAVAADPAGDHSVESMAERAALSVRHFARRFQQETGDTPGRYLERARVEAAQALLESCDDGMDLVAHRVGLGCSETLRRAFVRTIGTTPSAYRSRFRTTTRPWREARVVGL
ncbi:GlxA family transcriptional regulator [Sphaerisporangium fuscum]|uniref:GlxA family transcriptional regulator n=1 Tax=Sphaerisporangium fuscum TaxID=2835868 RepID=UPI001BDC811B|nr:DJ-1/PfpI family protein [Sphaerisporangium fuscum]